MFAPTTKPGAFWLSVAAYILPTFPLGYAWHLIAFERAYQALQLYRPEVIIPLGLAAMLIQALIFSWMYPRLFSTARPAWRASSLRAGLVFGGLAWSFTTLPVAAKYQMASVSQFLWLETSFTVLHFLVVAPLMAWTWRDRV